MLEAQRISERTKAGMARAKANVPINRFGELQSQALDLNDAKVAHYAAERLHRFRAGGAAIGGNRLLQTWIFYNDRALF
jgi:hypothetical protein